MVLINLSRSNEDSRGKSEQGKNEQEDEEGNAT